MEITETLQVLKEEWKEERDIETLLIPKEECEVEDIEFTEGCDPWSQWVSISRWTFLL